MAKTKSTKRKAQDHLEFDIELSARHIKARYKLRLVMNEAAEKYEQLLILKTSEEFQYGGKKFMIGVEKAPQVFKKMESRYLTLKKQMAKFQDQKKCEEDYEMMLEFCDDFDHWLPNAELYNSWEITNTNEYEVPKPKSDAPGCSSSHAMQK